MDGVHDLGGKQGYGPVDRKGEDAPFKSDDDARAYALAVSLRAESAMPVDWFRHVRERIDPGDYLTRPYFDQWLQTSLAMAVDCGDVTLEEIKAGAAQGLDRPAAPLRRADVARMVAAPPNFERPGPTPAFKVGDRVRAARHGHAGHTRLPAYARDAVGEVIASHGAHLFADACARGVEEAEPLYTVQFAATDLFPDAENPADRIALELWERYLVRA